LCHHCCGLTHIFKFKSSLATQLKILPPPCQSAINHESNLQHDYHGNIDTIEKENKARLDVVWWEAHKLSAMAQAQKTRI
jgi:hypothetical protein